MDSKIPIPPNPPNRELELRLPSQAIEKVEVQISHDSGAPSVRVQTEVAAELVADAVSDATETTSKVDEAASVETIRAPFVKSLGAWSKPLKFTPPATPPEPSTPIGNITYSPDGQLLSSWPSLNDGLRDGQKKKNSQRESKLTPNLPVTHLPPPALKADGSLRFPWAAKMNPASRNLFRVGDPTYRIDGTPQVTIPRKVLLSGPENQEQYVIGHFYRCSAPQGGLVHAVVNRIWGRNCNITSKKIGESDFLFHIPHDNTRSWVLHRGVWHVDDCLLFVAPWTPSASFDIPEISTVPVWVNLKNIPNKLYSRLGISHIGSGLGEPMLTDKPYLDPTLMGETKILVEVELDKPFPKQIALDDKQGNIFLVDVKYTWIPSVCERCGQLGHKVKRCLLPPNVPHTAKTTTPVSDNVPVVDVNHLVDHTTNVVPLSDSPQQEEPVQELLTAAVMQENANSTTQQQMGSADLHCQQISNNTVSITSLSSQADRETLYSESQTFSDQMQSHITPPREVSSPSFSHLLKDLAAPVDAINQQTTMENSPSGNTSMENTPSFKSDSGINHHANHTLTDDCPPENIAFQTPSTEIGSLQGETNEEVDGFEYKSTRGGRLIKPTQKLQEQEWQTMIGRGKHGRRGRGSHSLPYK